MNTLDQVSDYADPDEVYNWNYDIINKYNLKSKSEDCTGATAHYRLYNDTYIETLEKVSHKNYANNSITNINRVIRIWNNNNIYHFQKIATYMSRRGALEIFTDFAKTFYDYQKGIH